jgi:hypothetical protein
LNAGFFVYAEHQRIVRRIQIEADHISVSDHSKPASKDRN